MGCLQKNHCICPEAHLMRASLSRSFSLMDVANVTMFWACFSNGMSIILPREVRLPGRQRIQTSWKNARGNYRLPFCAHLSRQEHFRFHLNYTDFPTQLLKAKVNYRGQTSFLPLKREEKKTTLQLLMERKNHQTQDIGNCSFNSWQINRKQGWKENVNTSLYALKYCIGVCENSNTLWQLIVVGVNNLYGQVNWENASFLL